MVLYHVILTEIGFHMYLKPELFLVLLVHFCLLDCLLSFKSPSSPASKRQFNDSNIAVEIIRAFRHERDCGSCLRKLPKPKVFVCDFKSGRLKLK